MDTVNISTFKATCLALLDRVRRTGRPLRVTRRGEPVADVVPAAPVPPRATWLGARRGTGRIVGDIVAPAADAADWEALRR